MNKSAAGYYQLYAMTIRRSLGQRRELRYYADRKRVAGGKAIDAAIQQVSALTVNDHGPALSCALGETGGNIWHHQQPCIAHHYAGKRRADQCVLEPGTTL